MATRFCNQCGQPVEGNSSFCTNCGAPVQPETQPQEPQPTAQQPQPQPVQQQPAGPKPKNFLALSILATLFCCLPFGIPAIIFSAQVDSNWNAGRYQEARDASRKAKTWMLVSVGIGAFFIIAYIALIIIGVAANGPEFLEELQRYR